MKQLAGFAVGFVLISLALTWLWLSGGNDLYRDAMTPIAREFHDWIGLRRPGSMGRSRFINVVPFTALMLLTPGLSIRRRIGGLVFGLLFLSASHVFFNALAVLLRQPNRLPTVAAMMCDALPFVLWIVIARDFVQRTIHRVRKVGEVAVESDPKSTEQEQDQ